MTITYVYVDGGQREHPRVRQLFGHVPEEFLPALVPLDRVQGFLFQVVVAPHHGRIAFPDRYRDFDGHVFQTRYRTCEQTGVLFD